MISAAGKPHDCFKQKPRAALKCWPSARINVSTTDFCGGGVQAGRSSTSLMVADICLGLAAFAYRAFKDGGRGHGRTFARTHCRHRCARNSWDEPAVRSSDQPGHPAWRPPTTAHSGGADRLATCHHRQDAGVGRRRVNRSGRSDRCRDSYHQIKTDDVFRYTQGSRIDP